MATTEAGRRTPAAEDNARIVAQRSAAGMVAFALVVGAFVSGWSLSRRWRRFIGW